MSRLTKVSLIVLFFGAPVVAEAATDPCASPYAPQAVLECFLKLDSEGKRLRAESSEQIHGLTAWTEFPGWDGITVSLSYAVEAVPCEKPSAAKSCFRVAFVDHGEVYADFSRKHLKPKPFRHQVSYELEQKTASGWKIVSPGNYAPRVSPRYIRAHVESLMKSNQVNTFLNNALTLTETLRTLE